VVSTSDFTVAIPFLVNALLLLLTPFLGLAIESQLRGVLSDWFDGEVVETALVNPPTLARMSVWIGDASQTLTTAVGPLVGLLLLRPDVGSGIALLYVGSFVVAVAAFLGFVFLVPVAGYGRWRAPLFDWRVPLFSPLISAGILLNLFAAAVAALIGP
jgi:hypothetical protein